ncbi:7196_t:CDS:2, partial [Scutellospora calospora]
MLGRNQQFNQPCDYLKEICRDCEVNGNLNIEKRTIHIIGGKKRDVNEAFKRLKVLEKLRPSFKAQEIPLFMYHASIAKDAYIIIPVVRNPNTQKWTLPKYVEPEQNRSATMVNNNVNSNAPPRGRPITRNPPTEQKYDWPEVQQVPADIPWSSSNAFDTSSTKDFPTLSPSFVGSKSAASTTSTSTHSLSPSRREFLINTETQTFSSNASLFDGTKPRLTDEEKLARKEAKKQRIIDRRRQRSQYGTSTDNAAQVTDVFSSMSNPSDWVTPQDNNATTLEARVWSDKAAGKKVDEKGGINIVMRDVILEKSPNNSNSSVNGNNVPGTPGKILGYVRSQREEIRLFG